MDAKPAALLVLSFILVSAALASGVSALGLSYEYLENKTLPLAPGETRYFKLNIQNDESEDLILNVSVRSDIATLASRSQLEVPAKTYDQYAYFNISIPADAKPGDTYALNFSVVPVGRGEGQVPFSIRFDRSITILVREGTPVQEQAPQDLMYAPRPAASDTVKIISVVAVILIGAVVAALFWRRSRILTRSTAHAPHTKPRRHTSTAPEDQRFIARNGQAYQDLHELLAGLKEMTDEEFTHHVSERKNDFSTWASISLGERELATKMASAHTRKKMIKLLEDEL